MTRRSGGDVDLSAVRRWWPVGGVAALLAVAALAAPRSSLGLGPVQPVLDNPPRLPEFSPETAPTGAAEPTAAAAPERVVLPDWVVTAASVLCGVLVVAVVALLAYVLIRDAARRRTARRAPAPRPEVQ
ncbi:MAG TPA: hypothetical protein VF462_00205, partial [Micromonosporaceae bacterium]